MFPNSTYPGQDGYAPPGYSNYGAAGPATQDPGSSSQFGSVPLVIVASEPVQSPDGSSFSVILHVAANMIGKLVGSQGATIRDVQTKTGTRIQIDHKTLVRNGEYRKVHVTGTSSGLDAAKDAIQQALEADGPASASAAPGPVPGGYTRATQCPPGIVGRIIGKNGETIKGLQTASGAHIMVDQTSMGPSEPRIINISGRPDAVERALRMVEELIMGDPGAAMAVAQKYGSGAASQLLCPKPMVGRLIGKGGETIKGLQQQYRVSIQIDQSTDPCPVTITGPPANVQQAEQEVQNVINGAYGPPAGGYGSVTAGAGAAGGYGAGVEGNYGMAGGYADAGYASYGQQPGMEAYGQQGYDYTAAGAAAAYGQQGAEGAYAQQYAMTAEGYAPGTEPAAYGAAGGYAQAYGGDGAAGYGQAYGAQMGQAGGYGDMAQQQAADGGYGAAGYGAYGQAAGYGGAQMGQMAAAGGYDATGAGAAYGQMGGQMGQMQQGAAGYGQAAAGAAYGAQAAGQMGGAYGAAGYGAGQMGQMQGGGYGQGGM